MSIQLPIVDLSGATVGVRIPVDWQQQVQPQATPHGNIQGTQGMPHLSAFNESGVGLSVIFPIAGDTDFIPAGQWKSWTLDPAESGAIFIPSYILPGAAVTSLILVYYKPNEIVPTPGVLGNSPVNIGGNVNVSTAAALKNDGNLPNTSIIEATPSDQNSSSINLGNDGSGIWKILSAGLLRSVVNVVRGNSGTGKASVTIGDSGDVTITTFYGTIGAGVGLPASQVTGTLAASQVGSGYPGGNVSGAVATATNAIGLSYSTNGGYVSYSSGNNWVEYKSSATGAASGHIFSNWDGAIEHIPFSIGNGRLASASSYIDNVGNFFGNTVIVNGPQGSSFYQVLIPSTTNDQNACLDIIDNTAGGTRYQIGKTAVANGDTFRVIDATHGVTLLSLPPNGGIGTINANAHNANYLADPAHGTAATAIYGGTAPSHMYLGLAQGGGIGGITTISGSGSATVNHGLSQTPLAALVNNDAGSNSSTMGSGSYNGTSVFIYQFTAMAWIGQAIT